MTSEHGHDGLLDDFQESNRREEGPQGRSEWRARQCQIWHRIDLQRTSGAAWQFALNLHGMREGIPILKQPVLPHKEFASWEMPCSGMILGFEQEQWDEQIEWLLRFKAIHPKSIVIGWLPNVDPKRIHLFLEAGVSLLCGGYHHLQHCAKAAVECGASFQIEPNPIFRSIQNRLKTPQ